MYALLTIVYRCEHGRTVSSVYMCEHGRTVNMCTMGTMLALGALYAMVTLLTIVYSARIVNSCEQCAQLLAVCVRVAGENIFGW